MQTKKMSLANIQGKLSRSEMKNIMAGSSYTRCRNGSCQVYSSGSLYSGYCGTAVHSGSHSGSSPSTHCMCISSLGHYISTNNYAACTS
jgi:hypothetical protein